MNIIKKVFYSLLMFFSVPLIINASSVEVVGFEAIINVTEDRKMNVNEKIELYIIDESDSFERIINNKNFMNRKDGSKIYIDSRVSNISSKKLIDSSSTNKQNKIKLKLNEKKDMIETINLSYEYNLGKDTAKDFDEIYYSILNTDNIASNVVFEITLPKNVKVNNVSFSINNKYNLSKDDVTYQIEDNVITGYLNIMLNENEEFFIHVELPNNYFKNANDNFNYFKYLYLLFPLITFGIIFKYWYQYARKNKFQEQITTEIPYNFDPVEIGYLYKGTVDENDLVTDLIFLANKGYLKIEENEDGYKLGKENSFKFIKIKDYDKNNAVQKLLFEGIFKDKEIAELKDIEFGYSSKIIDMKKMIDNKDNRLKLFNLEINEVKKISLISLIISLLILNIEPIKQLTNSYLFVPIGAFIMGFGLSILFVLNTKGLLKKLFGVLLFGIVFVSSIYILLGQTQLLIIYILEILLIFISIRFYKKIPTRTIYGNKKLAEINAFKIGLLSMSATELEEKIKENSNYFYDMLPYAIVLGITNEWMMKGKNIFDDKPYWHITKEQFELNKEIRFFKNVIYTTSKVMIKAIYAKKESSQIEYKKFK